MAERPLSPLQRQALDGLRELRAVQERKDGGEFIKGGRQYPADAASLAYKIGLEGDIRHGNGAVKGSWSGRTSPALKMANVLRGLMARGLVRRDIFDRRSGYERTVYFLAD